MSGANTSVATLCSNSGYSAPHRKNAAQSYERSESHYSSRPAPKATPSRRQKLYGLSVSLFRSLPSASSFFARPM